MAYEVSDVKEAIDDINKDWQEFKAEHRKGKAADAQVLARINHALDEQDKKLARLSLGPPRNGESKAPTFQAEKKKAAFLAFARFGTEFEKWEQAEKERQAEGKWADAPIEQKMLINADDTQGGYLAPPEYVKEIIKAAVLISPMRGLVRVRNTGQRSIRVPKRTGTAAAKWVGETQPRSETQNPAYGMVEVTAEELTAEVYVSFADLEDSLFDLEAELTEEFSQQFAVSEGTAIVSGNGKAKPFGFTDASQGVPIFNSGSAATIQDVNGQANGIVDLFHGVKSEYAANGRWLLNRKTLGSVRKLQDSQKRYLWQPSPALGNPSTILGAEYTEVPDMPNEGAGLNPLAFGDWKRAYALADRISMSVMRDPYTQAANGAVKFLARRRVGGQVVLSEAAALLQCHV